MMVGHSRRSDEATRYNRTPLLSALNIEHFFAVYDAERVNRYLERIDFICGDWDVSKGFCDLIKTRDGR